mmetsp:Transcript_589/g.1039  ORF Transcript_589/g.1039 Transcript_589/m.1039 type:complete len:236 (+) Transcript_589:347-1054(+)
MDRALTVRIFMKAMEIKVWWLQLLLRFGPTCSASASPTASGSLAAEALGFNCILLVAMEVSSSSKLRASTLLFVSQSTTVLSSFSIAPTKRSKSCINFFFAAFRCSRLLLGTGRLSRSREWRLCSRACTHSFSDDHLGGCFDSSCCRNFVIARSSRSSNCFFIAIFSCLDLLFIALESHDVSSSLWSDPPELARTSKKLGAARIGRHAMTTNVICQDDKNPMTSATSKVDTTSTW